MAKNILVTGGAGYIGSHMVRTLIENNLNPIIFDNLSTGHLELVPKGIPCIIGDLKSYKDTYRALRDYRIDAVIHFAASALVGESMKAPIKYYENNVLASINLIKALVEMRVNQIVISSSCAVYGNQLGDLLCENDPTNPTNVYGRTKLIVEKILSDVAQRNELSFIILRYFNIAGAHYSGEIGEWHYPETHLIPNLLETVIKGGQFCIYGNDYPTPDGTCIRDYVHVEDICEAHWLALKVLSTGTKSEILNLGTGKGYSILEVVSSASTVTGKKIGFSFKMRREGDPPKLVASYEKARSSLCWEPRKSLEEMIESAFRWHRKIRKAK